LPRHGFYFLWYLFLGIPVWVYGDYRELFLVIHIQFSTRFRGGKGVATTMGGLLGVMPACLILGLITLGNHLFFHPLCGSRFDWIWSQSAGVCLCHCMVSRGFGCRRKSCAGICCHVMDCVEAPLEYHPTAKQARKTVFRKKIEIMNF
jgi:hypothetical protein